MVYYLSFISLKKHFKPCFFILKALKDILQHFKFVNWWVRGFPFFWCHEQVKPFFLHLDDNLESFSSHGVHFGCIYSFFLSFFIRSLFQFLFKKLKFKLLQLQFLAARLYFEWKKCVWMYYTLFRYKTDSQMTISQPFPAISLPHVCLSFTKLKFRRSFWYA